MSFHFALAELVEPGRFWIDYKLSRNGVEQRAASTLLDQDLNFLSLSPGAYQFEANLMSSADVTTESIIFDFQVLPFWWENSSIHLLLFGLALGITAVFFWLRSRAIERRYGLVANERKRVAQDLHDTFLQDVFGARMIGRSLAVEQSSEDAKVRVERVLELLESATTSVRASVHQLNNLTDVEDLSAAVRALEPPARFGGNIEIEVEQTGTPWAMREQRRFFLFRVIQEAITNACKHSRGSLIRIHLDWNWRTLSVIAKDDGVGFDRNADGFVRGFGLEAMDCMAEAARAHLDIRSGLEAGTTVQIKAQRFML